MRKSLGEEKDYYSGFPKTLFLPLWVSVKAEPESMLGKERISNIQARGFSVFFF